MWQGALFRVKISALHLTTLPRLLGDQVELLLCSLLLFPTDKPDSQYYIRKQHCIICI